MRSHPSDKQLIKRFYSNEKDFARLVTMSDEEKKVIRISTKFTRLEENWNWPREDIGFSQNRWNLYRALFKKLKINGGIKRENHDHDTVIYFIASSRGLAVSGSTKGYAYSKKNLTPLFSSLDNIKFSESGIAYKKLKDNWYLYYDYED
ncbi:MAG TPA: hypothetical protein VK338_02525 [Candidatus Nitrosocosmicus sp.]|nr:hypothetical protein [Candidatus Nitrosocosmicus sp.]